jgi:hypothetical protein
MEGRKGRCYGSFWYVTESSGPHMLMFRAYGTTTLLDDRLA